MFPLTLEEIKDVKEILEVVDDLFVTVSDYPLSTDYQKSLSVVYKNLDTLIDWVKEANLEAEHAEQVLAELDLEDEMLFPTDLDLDDSPPWEE